MRRTRLECTNGSHQIQSLSLICTFEHAHHRHSKQGVRVVTSSHDNPTVHLLCPREFLEDPQEEVEGCEVTEGEEGIKRREEHEVPGG